MPGRETQFKSSNFLLTGWFGLFCIYAFLTFCMPMFLKLLYKHSKLLFMMVIVFILGQLFINVKHGMVFSPFYHYGMYSQVMRPQSEYLVPEIVVDGILLKGNVFTPWAWDKILQPVNYFSAIRPSNALYKNEVTRLTPAFLLPGKTSNFIQPCDYQSFMEWYKEYLSDILGRPVKTVEIISRKYAFSNGKLEPTPITFTLSSQCQ